jgi:hypothetical protein
MVEHIEVPSIKDKEKRTAVKEEKISRNKFSEDGTEQEI